MTEKTTKPADARLRVVILNQYYVPDVASTGHLLHELARDLVARGVDVSVITCRPSYGPPETWQPAPLRATTDGVRVTRLITTRLSKDFLPWRILNSITFLAPLAARMLFRRNRGEVLLYTTNPPYLGMIGAFVSLIRRHPYVVLLHDSYPQMAVWVGKIREGGFIDRLWHRLNRLIYGRARETIVLCNKAKDLVCEEYRIPPEHVHIIHNWADSDELNPKPKAETEFARAHGLVEPFTVMYSGNLGLYYEFETILRAAELLKDENFRLVFIGAGGKRDWIAEQIEKRGLTNALLLPYEPFEKLNDSLNACDASLVTIDQGIEGVSFPSKLYSSLAVGRPILALSEEESELRDIVEDDEVGLWSALGDAESMAEGIRRLIQDPDRCARLGRAARDLFERQYTLQTCSRLYENVLRRAVEQDEGEPAEG